MCSIMVLITLECSLSNFSETSLEEVTGKGKKLSLPLTMEIISQIKTYFNAINNKIYTLLYNFL